VIAAHPSDIASPKPSRLASAKAGIAASDMTTTSKLCVSRYAVSGSNNWNGAVTIGVSSAGKCAACPRISGCPVVAMLRASAL
jgi:hypothetical protein